MVILIPAYEPDERLPALVADLRDAAPGSPIVVVDDGSGPAFRWVFEAARSAGATVIAHYPNRGKGYALKRGFAYIAGHHTGEDVVTADCDGQHAVADIVRVGAAVTPGSIVLGSRRFTGRVPLRSRFGNTVTRAVFSHVTGLRIEDTQTGLRGYPAGLLEWLRRIGGDRFEYEFSVLLEARRQGCEIVEVPIDTIYLDANASSHFRTIVDSARVYAPLVKFAFSSVSAFLLDFVLLFTVFALTANLAAAVVTARVCSATFNYAVNRNLVFAAGRRARVRVSAPRYFALAGAVMAANYGLMHLLHERLGLALLVSKVVTEAALFIFSYRVQQRYVFAPTTPARPVERIPERAGVAVGD